MPHARHAALAAALALACDRYDGGVALQGVGEALSYSALGLEARAIAATLVAAGLRTNEPVHVRVSNRPRDIAALLGVWLSGGVAVPLHRTTPDAVVARFLATTRARFVVTGDAQAPLSIVADVRPPVRSLLEGAALVVFTSGSTGAPKGVVIGHEAFHAKLLQIDGQLRYRAAERSLLVLNITFSFGLWFSLLTLMRGGTLVMREKFDPAAFAAVLVDERITRVGMVPTMMRVLFAAPLDAALDRVADRGALEQIVIGGESLGRTLADTIRARFASTELVDIYGLTETGTCDFFAFPRDYARHPGSIGRVAPDIEFRIVDHDDRAVAPGAVGELQIATPFVMNGYLDAPELTTAAFDGRWFRTGDLARTVDDGTVAASTVEGPTVELMGRKKEVISRGGNKVTPVEIEQCLCLHPDVAAAMAVGIEDPLLGERIHVLLVARAGVALDIAAVRESLAKALERYKHPDRYYLGDALPTGRTGKADRSQLRSLICDGAIEPVVT